MTSRALLAAAVLALTSIPTEAGSGAATVPVKPAKVCVQLAPDAPPFCAGSAFVPPKP
jgi:hypothetical protein